MTLPYRPSGPLNWLLDKFSVTPTWSLIGTTSAEKRSVGVLGELSVNRRLSNAEFLRVDPSASRKPNRFHESTLLQLDRMQKQASRMVGKSIRHYPIDLLCREEELIRNCRNCLHECSENLIVDISSMPKRFFFPMIALALRSGKHANIIVAYTSPAEYGKTLAEDPLPWSAFPMFGATPLTGKDLKLVIGVGYQPLRLNEIVSGIRFNRDNVELLLPFPSVHPGFMKNWEFIRQIREEIQHLGVQAIKRVPTMNTSIAFDKIVAITNNGATPAVLAPYGPKPISLAMCLYGICCQVGSVPVEVGYTQPQVYGDQYSIGMDLNSEGKPSINAYCIRLNGTNLYAILQ